MQSAEDRRGAPAAVWALAMVCVGAVVFALCTGAAHTAVRAARFSAARAGIGQIEAVLLLAEHVAEENGYGPPPAVYAGVLKSYDESYQTSLTNQERYVLKTMLAGFGEGRDFDFTVARYMEGGAVRTQVYFFPSRGRCDTRTDHYYLMSGSEVAERNG